MTCTYCSDEARGYDDGGEPTCGGYPCELVATPFPRVIEVSGEAECDECSGLGCSTCGGVT